MESSELYGRTSDIVGAGKLAIGDLVLPGISLQHFERWHKRFWLGRGGWAYLLKRSNFCYRHNIWC